MKLQWQSLKGVLNGEIDLIRLAILGASGHGKVVADAAIQQGIWSDIVFFDDAFPSKTNLECWPILGNTLDLINDLKSYHVIIAIGDNNTRLKKQTELEINGALIATVIHPKSIVRPFCEIEQGTCLEL